MKKLCLGLVLALSLTVGFLNQNHTSNLAVKEPVATTDKEIIIDTAAHDPSPGGR